MTEATDTRFADPELIKTGDGSYSIYLPQLNETYHSRHGALHESQYVYIDHGLADYWKQQLAKGETKKEVCVLEIGFGTGLNAWLAARWATANDVAVQYTSLEPYPIPTAMVGELQDGLEDPALFNQLHKVAWDEWNAIRPLFGLRKVAQRLEDWTTAQQLETQYDVIFYDAFGPSKQPEVWSAGNLLTCAQLLLHGGVLTTYCAQGQFRRDLKSAGLTLVKLPGPPHKNEMTQGWKI
jgi:tRNA U34 5-methylaminomethyl-2-thiouridine-forming methyltransferase MnmC